MTNKSPAPTIPPTMEEKLSTLFQDQALHKRDTGTFLSHTHSDEGGRFAKPQQVVGSAPVPEYPCLPEGNWSNQTNAIPPEEALGFSVDDYEPVGRQDEIEASIAALERAAKQGDLLPSHAEGRGVEGDRSANSSSVERSPIPYPNKAETSQKSLRPQRKPPR